MLEELLELLDSDDLRSAWIANVHRDGERLELTLSLEFEMSELPAQLWRIDCLQFRELRVVGGHCGCLDIERDHPLLWPYAGPHIQLSFRGRTGDPAPLLGELWEAHETVTGSWLELREFLNPNLTARDLLASGSGILAEGPRRLLEVYATVLARHSIDVSWVGEHAPVRWQEYQWVPELPDLKVLLLSGGSYVVAQDFAVRRLSPQAAV